MVTARDSVAIIEDEPISRRALAMLLRDCGYNAHAYRTAEEFLSDLVDGNEPSVVLADVDLPGLSGLELLEQLERRFPQLDAVLITAADNDHVHRFRQQHSCGYLRKPLDLPTLLSLLNQMQA